jgi:hypothetical protein
MEASPVIRAATVARANVCVEAVDARTGRVLSRTWQHNLTVDAGLNLIRDLLYGDGVAPTHGAVGTDATATVAGDTALHSEAFRDLIGQKTKGTKALTVRFIVPSGSANSSTLRECALFNASPGGTMYARATPDPVVKTSAILVIFTWTLSWAAA